MSKKVTKSTVHDVIGSDKGLPSDVACIFYAYYEAFLSKGFNAEQAFKLTILVADFYLRDK